MMFTKAERSPALRGKGQAALRSLLRHGRLRRGDALHLHLVTDGASRDIGEGLLRDALRGAAFRHQVIIHDVSELTEKLFPIVEAMQKHFSAGSGTYYSDSIFFLSVAMHRIMPKEITQIIQVDLDLKYKANIRDLFEEFDNFQEGAVIGIAREMQPVYSISATEACWQRPAHQTAKGSPAKKHADRCCISILPAGCQMDKQVTVPRTCTGCVSGLKSSLAAHMRPPRRSPCWHLR